MIRHEIAGVTVLLHDHQDVLDDVGRQAALDACNGIVNGVTRVGMFGSETVYLDNSIALGHWAPLIAGIADHGWPPFESHTNGLDYIRRIAAGDNPAGPLGPGVQNSAARILVALGAFGSGSNLLRILSTSTPAG